MTLLARATAALLGWAVACSAWAWADRPLKLIVPAPPGGTMDIVARVVGQQLAADSGQPVVVENRPGAGGGIGIQAMLQAPADGNTLVMAASNVLAEIPHVMKLPFDPFKDVLPVASVARSGVLLVSPASTPARDFQGLLAHLKTRKGAGSFASYSPGTVSQYAGLILSEQAGLDLQHVGYPGSPPALQQLLGGQIDVMFDGMLTAVPLVKAGKLRAYAFSGKTRSRHLPDVPTTTELGYPQLQFMGWVGVLAPARLPADVLARLQAALEKAAQAPAVRHKLAEVGLEPEVSVDTPALVRETRAMSERNAAIVKKFGIRLD
ncbi:Bug family tripartite tricarboxylate transporter substrate binding protein [Pseudorhodoferax sp.]|uniref:Bug family tripartite tricarboxylate transporter substrate binding protein n=1 Tax=Pseudorhodoferax sp. TaxID=1993553 RepID=UPI002DD64118|nr:tripartite tricarboxylate transporter substrate binding protein [Pseudorhodoferax sp.]